MLALLLQRRRSTEANQTLYDVWPSPALVHYICISRGSCPVTEFCPVQNSLCVRLAFSYIGSITTRHSSSGRQRKFASSYKEWNYRQSYAKAFCRNIFSSVSQQMRTDMWESYCCLIIWQTPPPIFGWAAITLGISPHSSLRFF